MFVRLWQRSVGKCSLCSRMRHCGFNKTISYSCNLYVCHEDTFFFRCIAISFLFNQFTGALAGFLLLEWNFCSQADCTQYLWILDVTFAFKERLFLFVLLFGFFFFNLPNPFGPMLHVCFVIKMNFLNFNLSSN